MVIQTHGSSSDKPDQEYVNRRDTWCSVGMKFAKTSTIWYEWPALKSASPHAEMYPSAKKGEGALSAGMP